MAGVSQMDPLLRAELPQASAAPMSRADIGRTVTTLVSDRLGIPAALLARPHAAWQFEAGAWPDVARAAATGFAADPD